MPNWCSNHITISSTNEESINHIWNVIHEDDDLNLMGLRPRPDDVGDGWHGWSVQHWGTKWSLDIHSIDLAEFFGEFTITIGASSAWSPPLELLAYITDRFTDVKADVSFHEQGMDFVGFAHCEDGQYLLSDGSISDNLPADFDWDSDDAQDVVNDTLDVLLDQHETHVMTQLTMKAGN